jgi:tetratricopeptide (TPR) repeat protein
MIPDGGEVRNGFTRLHEMGLTMIGISLPSCFTIPFKTRCILILLIFSHCLVLAGPVWAETRTFEKEYTYQAGDNDSKISSRTIALREIKRLLLEELGAYLESRTEVKDFQLTRDEVTTLTAGIVSTEIIAEKWDGRVYYVKAKVAADPDDVIKSIDRLRKDSEKTRELEETQRNMEALLKENEKLKQELTAARNGEKQVTLAAYEKNIRALDALEWFEKGYASATSGDCGEAITAYGKAIRLNPDYAPAYNNRGKCYARLGYYRQAIRDFTSAIALDPGLATTHYNRGNAFARLGWYRRAMMDFNRAIALDPGLAIAYNNRGNVCHRLGWYRRAIMDFSRAVAIDPGLTIAYYNRGNSYDRLGYRRQAVADLIRAARQGHENAGNTLRARGIAW